jgi:hypothetical protein
MRLIACLSALGLLACATGSNGNAPQPAVQNLGDQPTGNGHAVALGGNNPNGMVHSAMPTAIYTAPDRGVVKSVSTPIDKAYTDIMSGYVGIGVQILSSDPKGYVVGNKRVVVTSTLNGQALSKFFNCGYAASGFPRADSYRVTFSMLTSLYKVDSASTEITTLVTGAGEDPGTGATTSCHSTGVLERTLLRAAGYQ